MKHLIDAVVFYINLGMRKAFCFWGKPRVFLSSTYRDLIDERGTVTTLLRAAGFDVVRMEEGPELTDPSEIVAWSERQAASADICIFMLSYTRGTTYEASPNYRMSYTEHELTGAIYPYSICYFLNRPFYDARRLISARPTEAVSTKLEALLEMTQAGLAGSPEELASVRQEIECLEAEVGATGTAAADGCPRCDDEPSLVEKMHHDFMWGFALTDAGLANMGVRPGPPRTDLERAEQILMSASTETKSISTSGSDDQISLMQFIHRLQVHCLIFRRVDSVRRLAFYALQDTAFAADALQRARLSRLVKFSLLVVVSVLLLVILL